MRITQINVLILAVCLFVCSCKQKNTNDSSIILTPSSRFQPGQVWTFHTSPKERDNATLTIVQVDIDLKESPVIYIMITNKPHVYWEGTDMFYPFSEDALNRSVITLVKTNALLTDKELKDFQGTYEQVRQDMQMGKAGSFKISVADALEVQRKQNY